MPKRGFNKVARYNISKGCSPVNLKHIFRTPFPKNACGGLLLDRRHLYVFNSRLNT